MTGKQEGPYKGEETKAEEDKLWQYYLPTLYFLYNCIFFLIITIIIHICKIILIEK